MLRRSKMPPTHHRLLVPGKRECLCLSVPLSMGSSWLSPTATLLTWPLCFNPLSWYFFKVALGHAGFLLDIWKTETITKRKIELSGDHS